MRAGLWVGRVRPVLLLAVVCACFVLGLSLDAGPAGAQEESTPPAPETTGSAPPEDGGGEGEDPGVLDTLLPGDSDGDESGGGSEGGSGLTTDKGCDLNAPSYGIEMLAPDSDVDNSYMVCPPDNYYLEYIDWTNYDNLEVLGVDTGINNPFNDFNPFREVKMAPHHAINGLASTVFTINAKLMYLVISTMNFALDFNLVDTIGEPAQEIIRYLGDGFYMKWLTFVLGLSTLYAAWLMFVKNKVSEGIVALCTAAVVGAFGVWVIDGGSQTVGHVINDTTEVISDSAFFAVSGLNADSPEQQGNAPANASVRYADADVSAGDRAQADVSKLIWERYVLEPWSRMQISENDPGLAEQHREEILKISNPDERAKKLAELGEANKDTIAPTVDFLYSSSHLISAILSFLLSLFFALLVMGMIFMLIVSEFILFMLILSFPIWGLFAVFPGSGIPQRLGFYFLGEMIQILGYKLLISMVLLLVGLIFAAGGDLGTGGVFLLSLILTFVAFKFRKDLIRLLQPSGIVKQARDRWERERKRDGDPFTVGSTGQILRPRGGTEAAVGGDPGSPAQASGGASLAERFGRARGAHFLPDDVAGEVKGAAGAVALRGYRGSGAADAVAAGKARTAETLGGNRLVRLKPENDGASLLRAQRLDELGRKRAAGTLTPEEAAELHRAETMMAAGNNPLSEVRKANREDRIRARQMHRRARERGYATDEMLAGIRRPGESEAEYVRRQREARANAEGVRQRISDDARAGRTLSLVGAPRPCPSCGNEFSPTDPSQTVCPACLSRNGAGGGAGGGADGSGRQAQGADPTASGADGANGSGGSAERGLGGDAATAGAEAGAGDDEGLGRRAADYAKNEVAAEAASTEAAAAAFPRGYLEGRRFGPEAAAAGGALAALGAGQEAYDKEMAARVGGDGARTGDGMGTGADTGDDAALAQRREQEFSRRREQMAEDQRAIEHAAQQSPEQGDSEAFGRFQAERQRRGEYERQVEELGLGAGADGVPEGGAPGISPDELPEGARLDPRTGVVTGYSPMHEDPPEPPPGYRLNEVGSRSTPGWARDAVGAGRSNRYTWEPENPPVAMPEGASFDSATGVISGEVAPGGQPPTPPPGYAGHMEAQASVGEGSSPSIWRWTPTGEGQAEAQGAAQGVAQAVARSGGAFDGAPPVAVPAGASFDPASGAISGAFSAGDEIPVPPEGYEGRFQEAGLPGVYGSEGFDTSSAGGAPVAANDGFFEWTPTGADAGFGDPAPAEAARDAGDGWLDAPPVGMPEVQGDASPSDAPGFYGGGGWSGDAPAGRAQASPEVPQPTGAEGSGGWSEGFGGGGFADPGQGDGQGAARGPSAGAGRTDWGDGSGWGSGGWSEGAGASGGDDGLGGREQAVRNLAARGLSDAQIGESLGAGAGEVERFRSTHGIPTNAEGGGALPRFGATGVTPGEVPDDAFGGASGDVPGEVPGEVDAGPQEAADPPASFWLPPEDLEEGPEEPADPPAGDPADERDREDDR